MGGPQNGVPNMAARRTPVRVETKEPKKQGHVETSLSKGNKPAWLAPLAVLLEWGSGGALPDGNPLPPSPAQLRVQLRAAPLFRVRARKPIPQAPLPTIPAGLWHGLVGMGWEATGTGRGEEGRRLRARLP